MTNIQKSVDITNMSAERIKTESTKLQANSREMGEVINKIKAI
jgi:hypothetical protein